MEYRVLPKQHAFIFGDARHMLYSGAVGAGKSRALCIAAVLHTIDRPEARFGLFRKTLAGLKKSTLKTLLEGDGQAPPVLPQGSYTHNKTDREIRLYGGGAILYNGVETPEAVRSMNLSGAGTDETTELSFMDYAAVDDRVRLDVGVPNQIWSATNPGLPDHWLARMHGISPSKQEPDPDTCAVMTSTADNTFLPESYIKSFGRHEGTLYYDRMFLGKWVGSEGVVFTGFYRDRNVRERPASEAAYWWYGVDPGHTDPFAIVEVMVDSDKRIHIAREWYETGRTHADGVAALKSMMRDRESDVVVDSAEPSLVESLRREGVRAKPATKGPDSINYGVSLISQRLRDADDGRPRLTVDPQCTNTVREFESYEWQSGRDGFKDKPVDANNHTIDAIRYVAREIDGGEAFTFAAAGTGEAERRESAPKSFDEMRRDTEWGWD